MATENTARLAVLIDADNAQASITEGLLAEVAKYGTAHVKRAYGDWTAPNLRGWKDQLLAQSIQPIQQFAYTTGKNATDAAMVIDAMDLLYSGRFDGFCIVSSDSDFTRLAARLRESGMTVYGFGERKTPKPFVAACDNDYGTWNAFDNQSWPASYLIDAAGQIRHVSIGEGDYSGEEQLIRQLLTAAHPGIALPKATDVPDTTPDDSLQTPETYLGAEREQYYSGGAGYRTGEFTLPATVAANSFALGGGWTVGQQSITAGKGASVRLAFHASEVYLDVGGTGTLTVSSGGASSVIRVSGAPDIYTVAAEQPAKDGTVTIGLSPGLAAYSFTFG